MLQQVCMHPAPNSHFRKIRGSGFQCISAPTPAPAPAKPAGQPPVLTTGCRFPTCPACHCHSCRTLRTPAREAPGSVPSRQLKMHERAYPAHSHQAAASIPAACLPAARKAPGSPVRPCHNNSRAFSPYLLRDDPPLPPSLPLSPPLPPSLPPCPPGQCCRPASR